MTENLADQQESAFKKLLAQLIDQQTAHVVVPPYQAKYGFWFGGASLARGSDGIIWLSGRYRNYGDSRTGLAAGERGLECAIFRSEDGGHSFQKVCSWSKADLSRPERKVLSIEGTALHRLPDGTWELFVSSEKEMAYPAGLEQLQKPGTGVWTIDRLIGPSPDQVDPATMESVLENHDWPEYLHVKDPVVFDAPGGGTAMVFCSHPHAWSSSNTGLAVQPNDGGDFRLQNWEIVSRGAAWDVAATRITARLPLPQVGLFAGAPACAIYFYDGAECLRPHNENRQGHSRPRGYSCEELGGAFFGWDDAFPNMDRISRLEPLFVSPWGTGCSRYVDCLVTDAGILAVWQQSQPDESQPLVGHFLPMATVEQILSGG